MLKAFTHIENAPAELWRRYEIFWRFSRAQRFKLAYIFQASIHVHLCLPWQQTKLEHYFSNSIDGKTLLSFLQRWQRGWDTPFNRFSKQDGITLRIACENIRFSSLFAAGDVSRETSPAAKSKEKRMCSQATLRKVQKLLRITVDLFWLNCVQSEKKELCKCIVY